MNRTTTAAMMMFLWSWAVVSQATVNFSAQLEASKRSKLEFIKLVSELERQLPMASTKEETADLFRLILPLQKIAEDHQFTQVGGNFLGRFIETSCSAIAKWLDITQDHFEDLQLFVDLAPDSGQILFLDHQNQIFSHLLNDQEKFFAAYTRFAQLVSYHPQRNFQLRQGDLLGTLLRTWDISPEQAWGFAQSAQGSESLQEMFNFLQRKINQAQQPADFNLLIKTTLLLATKIEHSDTILPGHLLDAPGYTLVAILQQIIQAEQSFDNSLIASTLTKLDLRQLHDLASNLTQIPFDRWPPTPRNSLIALTTQTADLCQQRSLHHQVLLLEEFLGRLLLLEKTGNDIEGIYQVQMGGVDFRLLLVRTQMGQLAATLTNSLVAYGMFYAHYQRQSGEIIITRYQSGESSSGTDYGVNFALKLRPLPNHTLQLTFNSGTKLLAGIAKKQATIPNYLERPATSSSTSLSGPHGLYRGKIGPYLGLLIVENAANYFFAQLSFLEANNHNHNVITSVGLNMVIFQPWNRVLYLTSAETNALSFIHLRLVLSPDGKTLRGFYYSGGPTNNTPVTFTLSKK